MYYDQTATIQTFLNAAAGKTPIPGGGSVAAVVGALAASMGEMVLNYSVGKKSLAAHQDRLKPALAELSRAREVFLQLMTEDQAAYDTLNRLQKLPEDSPERREKYAAALLASIRVPQALAATAVSVLEIADRVADVANHYLLADLAVCADLAMATVRCGSYNVRANLQMLTDAEDRRKVESASGQVLARAGDLIRRVSPRIWARIEQGA